MKSPIKKIYDWTALRANSRFSPLWLGVIFALEIILFIPLDALLILFCLENPSRKFLYASIATIACTIGGVLGYFLGFFVWDIISPYVLGPLISFNFFDKLCAHYSLYQNWAIFIGSFLPLPFKAVTLSAGVCHLSLFHFISFVFLARFARFFLIAKAVEIWGIQIKIFLDKYLGRIIFALGAKIAIVFTFFCALGQ
jgi:membrane protein YqaA with SNARE-associated domain